MINASPALSEELKREKSTHPFGRVAKAHKLAAYTDMTFVKFKSPDKKAISPSNVISTFLVIATLNGFPHYDDPIDLTIAPYCLALKYQRTGNENFQLNSRLQRTCHKDARHFLYATNDRSSEWTDGSDSLSHYSPPPYSCQPCCRARDKI